MTKLPARELLDGTKIPETTTGEFRLAMGNLRQYLAELLGDEGTDRETARLTLGIDLDEIRSDIASKADGETVMTELAVRFFLRERPGIVAKPARTSFSSRLFCPVPLALPA